MKTRLVSMLLFGVVVLASAAECQVYYYGDNRRIPMQIYDDKVVVQLRESHRMDIDGLLGQAQ